MLQIPGAPALSAFRITKLLSRLQALEPRVTALASRYIHFVDIERPLASAEREVLERLLTYVPRVEFAAGTGGETLIIVPREGTISPWSSKATDIAHVCGLEAVGRTPRIGAPIASSGSRRPSSTSSTPLTTSRAPITGRPGCTGRGAPTNG